MHIFRSLTWTILWPIITVQFGASSSFSALLVLTLASAIGVGIALNIPDKWFYTYNISVYLLGAIFFWPVLNSKENQATSMIINLGFCGLLIGSGLVALFSVF